MQFNRLSAKVANEDEDLLELRELIDAQAVRLPGFGRCGIVSAQKLPRATTDSPRLIGMFIALMATPYTVVKRAGTVGDRLSLIENRKQR